LISLKCNAELKNNLYFLYLQENGTVWGIGANNYRPMGNGFKNSNHHRRASSRIG
jgi:hypothetical protein